MKPIHFAVALGLSLALSAPCRADELVAGELFRGTQVSLELKRPVHAATLSISGPNAFHARAEARRGVPTIDLAQSGPVADGLYTYHLDAATDETVKVRATLDNGRGARAPAEMRKGVAASGTFWVRSGAIVPVDRNAREDQRRPAQ
jgi:hypothetical protein